MAQHSNYAKDRDLMMEAYGSVEGEVPPTQSTAPARMLNEAHCDEEHLPDEGGGEVSKNLLELLIQAVLYEPELYDATFVKDLQAKIGTDPESVVAEIRNMVMGEGSMEDVEDVEGVSKDLLELLIQAVLYVPELYDATNLQSKIGTDPESVVAEIRNMVMGEESMEDVEDNEGESGFTNAQKEELKDIVHAILDKRDSEERAAEHYR